MSWEHLQDVWSKIHNKRVRAHFRDLVNDPDNDEAWNMFKENLNISLPRHSLFKACEIDDLDTANMTLLRTFMFWVVLGQASALHPPIYSMPTDRYQQQVKFAPQITMYFKEDFEDVEEGFAPIDAEVSFRVRDERYNTISQTEVQALANKIRLEFAISNGYRWQKGRVKLNYRDADRGYLLSINAFSEAVGRQLIGKVLDIQGHSIDASKLSIQQLGEAPPIVPPTETILGKRRRLPRRRPVGYVRFIYADLHVWGVPNAVCLVDRSGRRRTPVVTV